MTEKLKQKIEARQEPINNIEKLDNMIDNKEIIIEDNETSKQILEDEARNEVFKKATASQENEDKKIETHNYYSNQGFISKKQKDISYKKTIKRLQTEMKPSEKVFSQIIHNPLVEKTSEIISRTIARPNPLLYGSFFAFIITIISYSIARRMGYKLSGFETILSFFIGWTIGLAYDYIKKLIFNNKN